MENHSSNISTYTGLNNLSKILVYLETMTMTWFGNGVFADIIKLRWDHTGLGLALNPRTGVLIRTDTETHTGKKPRESEGRN